MSTRGVEAGRAFIRLGVLDETKKAFEAVKARALKVAKAIGNIANQTLAIGTAIAGPIALATRSFAQHGDMIDKVSKRTKLSTDAVQSLGFAFQQSGGTIQGMEAAIRGMNRNLIDMERGLSTATDNFSDLGLTAADFQGLNTEERFKLIIQRLGQISDESKRAGLAMKIFGRAGTDILPLIGQVDELQNEFERLGVKLDGETIQTAAEVTDEINRLRLTFMKMIAEIGSAVAGDLQDFASWLRDVVVSTAKWIKENQELISWVTKIAVEIAAVGVALKGVSLAFSAIAVLANPFAAAIAGAVLLISKLDTAQKMAQTVTDTIAGEDSYQKRMNQDAPGLRELAQKNAAKNKDFAERRKRTDKILEEIKAKAEQQVKDENAAFFGSVGSSITGGASGGMTGGGMRGKQLSPSDIVSAMSQAVSAVVEKGQGMMEQARTFASNNLQSSQSSNVNFGLSGLNAGADSGQQRQIHIQENVLRVLMEMNWKMDGGGVV